MCDTVHPRRSGIASGKLLFALVVAFLLVPLFGTSAQAQRTLKVAYMKHPIQDASFEMLEKWGKANNVTIVRIATAYEVFFEKVTQTLTSGGDQYDLVWHNDDWGQNWQKWLEPTDDIPNMKDVDRWPVAVIFANDDGKDTVVPMVHTLGTFFYRTDLIKPSELPKTWRELVTLSQRLQKSGKVKWGFVGGMKYPHTWFTLLWSMWSNNCDILKPFDERDNKKLAAAGWESGMKERCNQDVAEFWWDAINVHKITPPGAVTYSRTDANAIFQAGDAAITMADSTFYGDFNDPAKSKVAGKVSFASWPVGPKGKSPRAWNEIWGWAIPKGSKNKALAKQALNAMLADTEGQIAMWKATGGPPPSLKVQAQLRKQDPLFGVLMAATIDRVDRKGDFHSAYYFPEWGRVHKEYSDIMIEAISGKREDIPKVLQGGHDRIHKAATGG